MEDSSFVNQSIFIPGPSFEIELPALDALFPVHYTRRLLIFRCASSKQRNIQLTALKAGLKTLVSRCPILGGTVIPRPDSAVGSSQQGWHDIVPGPGIELVMRDLRTTVASYETLEAANFPALKLPFDLLMPFPQIIDSLHPLAACKIQFSAISGGTILTIAISHSVADGSGKNELTRVLAEATKAAQERGHGGTIGTGDSARTTDIGADRNVLRNMKSEIPFNIEHHPGYVSSLTHPSGGPFQGQTSVHPFQATSPEIPLVFCIPAAKLAELKADATRSGAPPISTHDALSALLWRSVLLVRSQRSASAQNLPLTTTGSIFMPSDVRRHIGLPSTYIGNVIYQLAATLDLGTLFSSSGLQHAANAIRHAITAVSPALVTSYLAMVNERWLDWAFLSKASTTGMGMGSDWKGESLYKHDWGDAFGPLVRYRYPNEAFNCVFPKLPNGDAEIMIGVMPDEAELVRSAECLGKYAVQ